MTGGSATAVLISLAFTSAMVLSAVKKRALQWRGGPRHCVVCKMPMRECRCR